MKILLPRNNWFQKHYSKLILIICFLLSWLSFVQGQQTPIVSQYFYNPYLINPALAGQSRDMKVFMLYRHQWVGIPDSPETQVLTIDGPLNDKKIGLGMNVTNDVSHIIGRLTAMLSGAYTVSFAKNNEISLGMSAGILRNQLDFDKIRADVTDPGILLNVENRTTLEGNAGLSYRVNKFRVGIVTEQLFNRSITYQNTADFRQASFSLVRHYLITTQYSFSINNDLELTPLVLFRSAQGLPAQLDVNATLRYRDILWTNLVYRHQAGIGLAAGAQINERLMVGYSYEIPTSDLRHVSSGSHELMIGMRFPSGNHKQPTPRAIKTKMMDDIKRESNAQFEKLDAIQQQSEKLNQQLAEYKRVIEQQNSDIEKLKKTLNYFDEELKSAIDKLKVDLRKESAFDKSQTYYLVIGATKTLLDAKSFQKVIRRETKLKPEIIQSENQAWFFIYSEEVSSPKEAQKKIKELDTRETRALLVGNPWIYKTSKKKD